MYATRTPGVGSRRLHLFVKFILGGVAASLLPIAVSGAQLWVQHGSFELPPIIGRGQVYLVCAGITGGAIGELLFCGLHRHIFRVVSGFFALLLFGVSVWMYAISADAKPIANPGVPEQSFSQKRRKPSSDETEQKALMDRQSRISLYFLAGCVVVGTLCVIMSED